MSVNNSILGSNKAESESTLASHITQRLRDAIVQGEIKPGSKLSEPKLAESFQISRGPLREAIRRLESMKLVTYVPRGGARVVTLELPQVIEIYHLREALEGKAAALAAKHISEEGLNQLESLLSLAEEHVASSGGTYPQADADFDFHYLIIKSSGNQMLIHMLCDELYSLLRMYRYQSSFQPKRSNQAIQEHRMLLIALQQRDEQLAELIMRKHIIRARQHIEQQLSGINHDSK